MLIVLFTAWWFWISVAAFIFLMICEAYETSVGATAVAVLALVLYQFAAGVDVFGYVKNNPLSIVEWIGFYLVAGVIWTTFKWWLFALNQRDAYVKMRQEFLALNEVEGDKIPLGLRDKWLSKVGYKWDFPPKVGRNKAKIIRWMAYWPTSILWTLVDDFIRRVYTAIYDFISSTLQKISDSVFAKTIKDEWDEE